MGLVGYETLNIDRSADEGMIFTDHDGEQVEAGNPRFVWWNGTRMHFRTHVALEMQECADEIAGRTVNEYADGMVEHDLHIGKFLDLLDEPGIADATIVFYSTDNGPPTNTWPHAAWNPFRGETNTNGAGGWRVPAMVRWPGTGEPGAVTNEVVHHMDWLPTLLHAAGRPGIKEELRTAGVAVDALGRDFRVHLDGYELTPLLSGESEASPRKEIFDFCDDGNLSALRDTA